MGVSAGRVTVDDGEGMGGIGVRAGKTTDDDEDLRRDYGDHGGGEGGLLEEELEYHQAIEKIRIIEQVRENLAYTRPSRLQPRQVESSSSSIGAVAVGLLGSVVSKFSDILEGASDASIVSNSIGSSTSALLDTSLASTPLTSLLTDITTSTTLLTISSTNSPPPSPAETSAGMSIPPTTSSTSSLSSSITPRPQNTGSSTTRPYTTITSYLTSQISRNNGTTTSNTRSTGSTTLTSSQPSASTVTVDGTVVVYTYSTSTQELSSSSSTGNSSTRTSTFSVSSGSLNSTATSTTSSESLATSLLGSGTDIAEGGGGGGYVAPTSSTSASAVPTSTTTPSDNNPPVSPSLLGGVLGGVAGMAFILVAILYLLRRHKKAVAAQQRDDAGYGGPLEGAEGDQMMQRSAGVAPFALAGSFFRNPRTPRVSQSSDTPTVPSTSEVGFYKVSGRKLAPVLGGPRPGYGSTRSAGGSSYYPDDDGITVASTPSVVGPSRYSSMTASSTSPTGSTAPMNFSSTAPPAPPSTHMPPHIGSSMAPPPPRIQEEPVESDNESTDRLPRPPPFPRQLSTVSVGSAGKDGVGRSLPSHDGSRASRFTEDIV